jgi:hypothetical protein
LCELGTSSGTQKNADECDSDLNGGEKAGRFGHEFHGNPGALVSVFRTLLQPGAARGHHRRLGECEYSVGYDENYHNEQFREVRLHYL